MNPQSPASSNQSGGAKSFGSRQGSTGATIPDGLSVEESGRMFSAYREGKYLLPNDGDEQDRLDLQHHQWLLMLDGKLSLSPLGPPDPADVLDIGTGTGIWARQFAKQHPKSQVSVESLSMTVILYLPSRRINPVIGTDLSLIQPKEDLPPNCTFVREDSEEIWVFDKPFDYIHWRLMLTCFDDFRGMINKIFENLKPGGWAEFQETSFELVPADEEAAAVLAASSLPQSVTYSLEAGRRIGRDFEAPKKLRQTMTDAGFIDVVERQILAPINGWPVNPQDHEIGNWLCLNAIKVAESLSKILKVGGLPEDEIPAFQQRMRHDMTNRNMRVYQPQYVVYGRKPLDEKQL